VKSEKWEVRSKMAKYEVGRTKYEWDQTLPPGRANDIFNSPVLLAPGKMKYI
jgi:hypothetical protein